MAYLTSILTMVEKSLIR